MNYVRLKRLFCFMFIGGVSVYALQYSLRSMSAVFIGTREAGPVARIPAAEQLQAARLSQSRLPRHHGVSVHVALLLPAAVPHFHASNC